MAKDKADGLHLDFVIIGAAKCATTSLYRAMETHPGIFLPYDNEINLFDEDENYALGPKWWSTYYKDSAQITPKPIMGNTDNYYFLSSNAPERIKAHNSEMKLIVILRDPVKRVWSEYLFRVKLGLEKRDFSDIVRSEVDSKSELPRFRDIKYPYLITGRYTEALSRYIKIFGRDKLKILFTEDFASDPDATLADVFAFLGVDTSYKVPRDVLLMNVSAVPRIPALTHLFTKIRLFPTRRTKVFLRTLLGHRATIWLKKSMKFIESSNQKAVKSKLLDKDLLHLLQSYYKDDVEKLKDLAGRIPDKWGPYE